MKNIEEYKLFNESLKDKLKGPSEDDIKKEIGEEKFHIWKAYSDAMNSLKKPFKIVKPWGFNMFGKSNDIRSFEVRFWWVYFVIFFNGDEWNCTYKYNDIVENHHGTWDDVYNKIIIDVKDSFDKESKTIKKEIKRHEDKLDEMEKDLSKIN